MKRIATFAAMLVLAACAAKEEAPAADTAAAAPAAAPAAEVAAPVADTMKMDSTAIVAPVADSAKKM